MNFTCFIYFCR